MTEQAPDVGRPGERQSHTATTSEEAMAAESGEGATTEEQAYAPHPGPDDARRNGRSDAPTDVGRDTGPESTPHRERMAAETD